ncbi:DUF4179 domain-containing protein [bacterium LRH843]|nr:DUF4179 domain-containing protein [bacterium LRH843]
MKTIEKRLAEEKKRMDLLTAPEELELRLRNALAETPKKIKRKRPIWKLAAVALFCLIVISYQYNAFAFYGKKLLGFDEVIDGTLKELNDEGMGQVVDKKITFADGTDFIIDGIMTDANQLIMYYTLFNPNGVDEQTNELFLFPKITGFLTKSNVESGTSLMNDSGTEIKGMMTFEPVSPFSKTLTLHIREHYQNGGQLIEEQLTFPYNPNEAMQTQIKKSINKTVKVDKGTIYFNSIKATPTMTVIDGSLRVENFDRVNLALDRIELLANGIPVQMIGSGSKSSLKGRKFDIRYEALPVQLDSLELVMKEFVGYQTLNEMISLAADGNESILLDGKELQVKDILVTSQGLELTIATDEDVMLDGVSVKRGNEITSLKTTVNQLYTEQEDGEMKKVRTLLFDIRHEPEYLIIEGMHYMKEYNHVIKIPID